MRRYLVEVLDNESPRWRNVRMKAVCGIRCLTIRIAMLEASSATAGLPTVFLSGAQTLSNGTMRGWRKKLFGDGYLAGS
ncbi:hypothetical protein KCP69_17820 [Salmonella enterica subsp. enterica]|nr:hypothetical protein KCP69_17820 [Salmonella enterica subsp. enterica]